MSIPFDEREFGIDEMTSADEILVTSTTKLCKTVGFINAHPVGGKDTYLASKICENMYKEYLEFCLR